MKVFLTLLVLLAQTAVAQQPSEQSSTTWNQKIQQLSFGGAGGQEYRLGNGDLIEINVFGVENFKQQVRVNSSGSVTFPYVGTVQVAGMTPTEVEEKMRSLLDEKYIKNPQVTVFVAEYRSQPVFVLGAVQKPGQYQITSSLQLVDAIALAGGLNTETAAGYAIIQRRPRDQAAAASGQLDQAGQTGQPMDGKAAQAARPTQPQPAQAAQSAGPAEGPQTVKASQTGQTGQVAQASVATSGVAGTGNPETIRIDLRELLERGRMDLNIPIQGGDVVQIPEKQIARFYVIGDVNRPGAYELPTENQLFVTQALAWAGGPMRTAKKSKGVLVRYDERGGRQEMAINVDDIMKGKNPDITVMPNDVIFLPGSTAKSIGYGLLGVLPGTASSALVYGTVRR